MRAYIVTTFAGVFGVDDNNKVVKFTAFPKDPKIAATKLKTSEIEMLEEERKTRDLLGKKGFREFIYSYRKEGAKHVEPNNKAEVYVKQNIRELAIKNGFVKDQAEFNQFLTKMNLELTKVKIKKSVQRDKLIVQLNGAIEELDKSINIFIERLREWYGLHFPEMDRLVSSHEKYAKLVQKFGNRTNIDDADLSSLKNNSMGADFSDSDIVAMQMYAGKILEMYQLRKDLSDYTEKLLNEIAPNFLDIAGSALAAKLIARAGGLEKLAKMPSSKVQLLGAEKALFRFLHGKGRSPRHGIIFSHPLIQGAPDEHRGKIARLVSAKLAIAAKIDFYSHEYRGDGMKKELAEKVKNALKGK